MNITVYGSGYVGLVMAACFAQAGHQVVCVDIDPDKILSLQKGIAPFYEPELEDLLYKALSAGTLTFTLDMAQAVAHGECQFIAVGTPPDNEGNADLSAVMNVCDGIAAHLDRYTIIINKSTVPIGTADKVRRRIEVGLDAHGKTLLFDVVSNPEFLKQGAAVKDFQHPDRVVLGVESERAEAKLRELFTPYCENAEQLLVMDCRSAECVKYAANALLATKISFINEIANVAQAVNADIEQVRRGISLDPRIGPHFIQPGVGYGGSCFGKDIKALIHTAMTEAMPHDILSAVEKVNQNQKLRLIEKILKHYDYNVKGKTFALWGLSFKPHTNDMRDAPSIDIVRALMEAGARIQAYDPKAMADAKKIFKDHQEIAYSPDAESALEGANGLIVLTEWPIFKTVALETIKTSLNEAVIFDGRNIFKPDALKSLGFRYYGIGR